VDDFLRMPAEAKLRYPGVSGEGHFVHDGDGTKTRGLAQATWGRMNSAPGGEGAGNLVDSIPTRRSYRDRGDRKADAHHAGCSPVSIANDLAKYLHPSGRRSPIELAALNVNHLASRRACLSRDLQPIIIVAPRSARARGVSTARRAERLLGTTSSGTARRARRSFIGIKASISLIPHFISYEEAPCDDNLRPAVLLLVCSRSSRGVYPAVVTLRAALLPTEGGREPDRPEREVIGSELIGQSFEERGTLWTPSRLRRCPTMARLRRLNLGPRIPRSRGVDFAWPRVRREPGCSGRDPGGSRDSSPAASIRTSHRAGTGRYSVAAARDSRRARARDGREAHRARTFGVSCELRVNVLELNLALDAAR